MHNGLGQHKKIITNLDTGLKTQKSHIEAMDLGLKNHQTHIVQIRDGLNSQKEYMEKLGSGVEDQRRDVDMIRQELSALNDNPGCSTRNLTRLDNGLKYQKEAIESLARDLMELKAAQTHADNRFDPGHLESSLHSHQTTIESLKMDIAALKNADSMGTCETQNRTINALRNDVAAMKTLVSSLEARTDPVSEFGPELKQVKTGLKLQRTAMESLSASTLQEWKSIKADIQTEFDSLSKRLSA
jgi:chromosome segregation ATPase